MTREEFLIEHIKAKGTIKAFAAEIDMPYTTLRSILTNVGGATLDNIVKICRALNIPLVFMGSAEISQDAIAITKDERDFIYDFRMLNKAGKRKVFEYLTDLNGTDNYVEA